MFEIGFFKAQPEPFYKLANKLFPQELNPTISHLFVRLMHDKGYLLRHYTQVRFPDLIML
jgi:NAD-dependent SIR2 family protein deacetylase